MRFKPNGNLNLASEATDLGENDLQRCKNLRLLRQGQAQTRYGSEVIGSLPGGDIANLIMEQSGARYEFAGSSIYRNEASIASGLTEAQWSGFKYNSYNDTTENIFALNGTDRRRIEGANVYKWGIAAPTVKATLAAGASTGLTGDYKVKYTYARYSGSTLLSESNPSPASSSQTLSNQSLDITWTASGDSQVTHVRIYRTLANGDLYYHLEDVAIGTTNDDDNTADTSLGDEVEVDHNRPPAGTVCAGPFFNGYCFIAKGNLLYWCKPQQPEYWPTANYIEVGGPQFTINNIVEDAGTIYVITHEKKYLIQGTAAPFRPLDLSTITGTENLYGAISVQGRGILNIWHDGIYLYSGGVEKSISQETLAPLFRGESIAGIPAIDVLNDAGTMWLFQYQNRVYFHWKEGNIFILDLDGKRHYYYKYPDQLSAPGLDHETHQFLVCDQNGNIIEIEDTANTNAVDYDGTNVSWEIQWRDFTDQLNRFFPKYAIYDVEGTATAEIVLDGVVHQTHSITERNDKRRLIDEGNGNRCSLRLTGTGSATVYAAMME